MENKEYKIIIKESDLMCLSLLSSFVVRVESVQNNIIEIHYKIINEQLIGYDYINPECVCNTYKKLVGAVKMVSDITRKNPREIVRTIAKAIQKEKFVSFYLTKNEILATLFITSTVIRIESDRMLKHKKLGNVFEDLMKYSLEAYGNLLMYVTKNIFELESKLYDVDMQDSKHKVKLFRER